MQQHVCTTNAMLIKTLIIRMTKTGKCRSASAASTSIESCPALRSRISLKILKGFRVLRTRSLLISVAPVGASPSPGNAEDVQVIQQQARSSAAMSTLVTFEETEFLKNMRYTKKHIKIALCSNACLVPSHNRDRTTVSITATGTEVSISNASDPFAYRHATNRNLS